mmetsp:Transcript_5139/g.8644  ORF Transcript_5139/g.8644 Transcript_5139/m.8644 type:complete len:229 (+) Transcript_5139:76-762(+)
MDDRFLASASARVVSFGGACARAPFPPEAAAASSSCSCCSCAAAPNTLMVLRREGLFVEKEWPRIITRLLSTTPVSSSISPVSSTSWTYHGPCRGLYWPVEARPPFFCSRFLERLRRARGRPLCSSPPSRRRRSWGSLGLSRSCSCVWRSSPASSMASSALRSLWFSCAPRHSICRSTSSAVFRRSKCPLPCSAPPPPAPQSPRRRPRSSRLPTPRSASVRTCGAPPP